MVGYNVQSAVDTKHVRLRPWPRSRDGGRWPGYIWSARELPATMRDRPKQRPLGIIAQAAVIDIGGRILHALFPVTVLSDQNGDHSGRASLYFNNIWRRECQSILIE